MKKSITQYSQSPPKTARIVVAADADNERPKEIVYSLTGQGVDDDNPINNKFEIGRTTGEIVDLKPLNRDEPLGRPQWRFTDINDNAPAFLQGVYNGHVTENSTAGEYVMTISAVDYDDPEDGGNADIVYSLEDNVVEEATEEPIFEMYYSTVVTRTAVCCLDREMAPVYVIQLVAVGGGGLKGINMQRKVDVGDPRTNYITQSRSVAGFGTRLSSDLVISSAEPRACARLACPRLVASDSLVTPGPPAPAPRSRLPSSLRVTSSTLLVSSWTGSLRRSAQIHDQGEQRVVVAYHRPTQPRVHCCRDSWRQTPFPVQLERSELCGNGSLAFRPVCDSSCFGTYSSSGLTARVFSFIRCRWREGRYYNEKWSSCTHHWLLVDKQEGFYAGGMAKYTVVRTFDVQADFHEGFLDTTQRCLRLDGRLLPHPPAMNSTQWGQATMARNLDKFRPSNSSCTNTVCPDPFQCVDLWHEYECLNSNSCTKNVHICGEGKLPTADGRDCVDENECKDNPCRNGGVCIIQEPRIRYLCVCPAGFLGKKYDVAQEIHTVKLGMGALATILGCLLLILMLVLLLVIYNRPREPPVKKPRPEVYIRENIISYNEVKCLKTKKNSHLCMFTYSCHVSTESTMSEERGWGPSIAACRALADGDMSAPPFEELQHYAYEDSGSISVSLSSVVSESDTSQQFDQLNMWGTKFSKLSLLYQRSECEEDERNT
ncbi:beta-catenin binding [Homalodisca vitripennis]|nr:beta-catenin binding [Homalodisca vitripennis]